MPWFNIWDGLKSKICRYFLRRYLGQFLDDELNLEQLKLELCGGKATLCDVALKVEVRKSFLLSRKISLQIKGSELFQFSMELIPQLKLSTYINN